MNLLVAAVFCHLVQSNCMKNLTELIRYLPQLTVLSRMMDQRNCSLGAYFNQTSQENMTIFAPVDSAWNEFGLRGNESQNLSCSFSNTTTFNCPELFGNKTTSSGKNSSSGFKDCYQWFALYHVSPQMIDGCSNSTSGGNVTVVPTYLDQFYARNQSGNYSMIAGQTKQVLIVNATINGTEVRGGGNSTAKILGTYMASDGRLHLIDRVLIPPLPLNYTLRAFNISQSDFQYPSYPGQNNTGGGYGYGYGATDRQNTTLNRTMGNFTVFYPLGQRGGVDLQAYTIPQVIYLNSTQPREYNVTALDGRTHVLIQLGQNYTATVGRNSSVVLANIPLINGVLHFLNNNISPVGRNQTMSAQLLQSNQQQWLRWIRVR